MFCTSKFHKIECKNETYQWRKYGNICIEYRNYGKLSGISVTTADHWVHTLHEDDGSILIHYVFPIERLKALARHFWPDRRIGGGDDKAACNIVIPIRALTMRLSKAQPSDGEWPWLVGWNGNGEQESLLLG